MSDVRVPFTAFHHLVPPVSASFRETEGKDGGPAGKTRTTEEASQSSGAAFLMY